MGYLINKFNFIKMYLEIANEVQKKFQPFGHNFHDFLHIIFRYRTLVVPGIKWNHTLSHILTESSKLCFIGEVSTHSEKQSKLWKLQV